MAYNPTHTSFVGYRGFASLNGVLLLASSAQATINATAIKSTANWGAGSWNAADTVAWSADMPTIDASIDCDVTTKSVGKIEKFSSRYGLVDGATPIVIRPSNSWGFDGSGYCDSLTLSCGEKQNLTASIEAKAFFANAQSVRDFNAPGVPSDGQNYADRGIGYGATQGDMNANATPNANTSVAEMPYNALYPYWGQKVYLGFPYGDATPHPTPGKPISRGNVPLSSEPIRGIVDWKAQLTNNIQFKKTCSYNASLKADGLWPLAPDYVALGAETGSCDITFVGTLDEYDFNYFYHTRSFKVTYSSPVAEESDVTWEHAVIIPAMTCESYPLANGNGNDIVTASFTYNAVGNGSDPPVYLPAWLAARI